MAFTKYKPEGPRKANFLGGAKEAPKNENWHESPKVEAQEGSETQEEKVAMTHGPLPLKGIYSAMNMGVFQKGGLSEKNSDYYNAVVTDLARVIGSWSVSLSGDMKEMQKAFSNTEYFYGELIKSCNKYLKRRSFSSQGKARQEIVRNILDQAEIDKHSLKEYFLKHQSLSESERASNVQDALAIARRKVLIMGKADSEYEHVGGKSSRLTVFEKGDLQDNTTGFFKERESYTYRGDKEQNELPNILERARKITPISDELYKKVCKYVNKKYIRFKKNMEIEGGCLADMKEEKEFMSMEFDDFYKTVNALCCNWFTVCGQVSAEKMLNVDLKEGESISLTNRNVASSRVAEALGVGNLIAKSETVEMREPGQKKGRVGNLMQKAGGKGGDKIVKEHWAKEGDKSKRVDAITKKMTGNFQKELINLQVLDYLLGQIDRNMGNIFMDTKKVNGEDKLNSVTGIDNDYSFGNAKVRKFDECGKAIFTFGAYGSSPVDLEGNFLLPHMDKTFAEHILALTDEQLTYLLGDLIEKENIKHVCERLHILQNAIKNKMNEEGSEKIFLTDDKQWGDDTLEAFRNMSDECALGSANYLNRFLGQVRLK